MSFYHTKGIKILHPPLYPLPSREGKVTPLHSSPYLRGGWVGLIPLPLWPWLVEEKARERGYLGK